MIIPTSDWDEEEYAEQIRLNRWTQLHGELPPASKAPSTAPTATRTENRPAKILAQQQKRERIRLEAQHCQEAEYRANYARAWETLNSTRTPLRFTSFTWPIYPPLPLPPLSFPAPHQLSKSKIRQFLTDFVDNPPTVPAKRPYSLGDLSAVPATLSVDPSANATVPASATKSLKSLTRSTLLRYHPDRFAPLLERISDPLTRGRVTNLANLATENLSTLLKELAREEKEERDRQTGEGVLEEEGDKRRRKRRKETEQEDRDESARVWERDSE